MMEKAWLDKPLGKANKKREMNTKQISANSWEGRDLNSHLHGFQISILCAQHGPAIISIGDGVYVTDVHGKQYLEGNSGLWNVVVGFNNSELQEAACQQF